MAIPAGARYVCVLMLAAASVLLPLGVLMPTITIDMKDPLTEWVGTGFPEYRAKSDTFSIVGVTEELWRTGSQALSIIIFAFSLVFPVAKLLVLWAGAWSMWRGATSAGLRRCVWLSDKLGKWSMLDVLVIAIAVVTLKQFPGGVQVVLGSGIWLFGASVVLAMLAGAILHNWHASSGGGE